jgi:hypothetical protein
VTGAEIASLKWLADVLKSLASSVMGDRLKPRTSEQRAWILGKGLWDSLASLRSSSTYFVVALREVIESVNLQLENKIEGADQVGLGFSSDHPVYLRSVIASSVERWLPYAMDQVVENLENVSDALAAINPQLEIHVPEIAEQIYSSTFERGAVIRRAALEMEDPFGRPASPAVLASILADAEAALVEIDKATEGIRAFLAKEFNFKDSF